MAISTQIIDGKAIAEEVRAEVKQRADRLHERGITPGLALILVGDNPSSLSYVRSKGDSAEQAGIYSDMFHLPETTDEETLISRIMEINRDDRFHGVLVQLPLAEAAARRPRRRRDRLRQGRRRPDRRQRRPPPARRALPAGPPPQPASSRCCTAAVTLLPASTWSSAAAPTSSASRSPRSSCRRATAPTPPSRCATPAP